MKKSFIAFDLGATSGRTMLGTLDTDGSFELEEINRFSNGPVAVGQTLRWDIHALFANMLEGLRLVAAKGVTPTSIGIDTWGVDYACLDAEGNIIELPYAYRDYRTAGAKERFFATAMDADTLYGLTGIQHMDFNTIFQLHEHRHDASHRDACMHIFLPDLLSYMLTGNRVTEYTIASTGAIVDPATKALSGHVLDAVGRTSAHFAPLVFPGHVVGMLKEDIAADAGLPQVPVVAVAGHDTASAVAAVPAGDANFAYLSSGTWSLMGIETAMPVINDTTRHHNITNEGGVGGTVRLLKNITGMWIVERCIAAWATQGYSYNYNEAVQMARSSAHVCTIDPDDASFAAPDDMPAAIDAYCRRSGQPVPATHGEYLRSIFESLAIRYAAVLDTFRALAPHPIDNLHIIGGGSRNAFLNQLTANRCGIPVVAGPAEATAIGNIMIQAMAAGIVDSLAGMRAIIAKNIETTTYNPI